MWNRMYENDLNNLLIGFFVGYMLVIWCIRPTQPTQLVSEKYCNGSE